MPKTKTNVATAATNNASIPATSFGWFYGKNGEVKHIVSKPFTIEELKKEQHN